ncbi:MAG: hypothetical protein ACREA9_23950 [Pyrinomonadaceae bacterium]
MKKLIAIAIGLGVVSAVAIFSVSTAEPQDNRAPERFASFEMKWDTAMPETIGARAQAVVEIMTGQTMKRRASVLAVKSLDGVVRRMEAKLPEAPGMEIEYLREYDELRIVDSELAVSTRPKYDISRDDALKAARKVFEQLAGRKIVDSQQFDWDRVDTASTMVGEGSNDGKKTDKRRTEYRFTLRRVLNGIDVANAGIRIVIHASGRVSSVRVGGVSIASKVGAGGREEPTGTGRWLERRVTDDPTARFDRELVPKEAKAKIAWSRVMYVMPENKRAAVVEPLHVISYSLEFPTKDGPSVVSRRQTVGFSLVDPKAAPVDLTPPVRAPQIEKTRKQY